MPPKSGRKRESLIRTNLEHCTDSEIRQKCKSYGLSPGPINDRTRSAWIRRLVAKELEIATKSPPKAELSHDEFNFSADEEALGGTETSLNIPKTSKTDASIESTNAVTQTNGVRTIEVTQTNGIEDDFSDSDNFDSEASTKSETEQVTTDNKEVVDKVVTVPEKVTEQATEADNNTTKATPLQANCCQEAIGQIKEWFDATQKYLTENKDEIIHLVIIILIAYSFYAFKDQLSQHSWCCIRRKFTEKFNEIVDGAKDFIGIENGQAAPVVPSPKPTVEAMADQPTDNTATN